MDAGSLDPSSLPHQEARNSPNTAQDQPKAARTRPKRRQQGPKRAPRRAPKGRQTGPRRPRRASGRPKREHPRVGRQPWPSSGVNRAGSGLFWGPFWGPSWADNSPKLTLERVQKGVETCMPEKTPGEPESQLKEASGRPPRPKSLNSYVLYNVFEVSSLCA